MKRICAVACCLALFSIGSALASEDAVVVNKAGEKMYKSACVGCHGVDGGKTPGNTVPLKDQSGEEIFTKLKGYAAQTYGGEKKQTMQNIAKKYSEKELKNVAEYVGTL